MDLVSQNTVATGAIGRQISIRRALVIAAVGLALIGAIIAWNSLQSTSGAGIGVEKTSAGDNLLDPALIEFRRGERASGTGAASAGDNLLDPALVEFRRGERASGTETQPDR